MFAGEIHAALSSDGASAAASAVRTVLRCGHKAGSKVRSGPKGTAGRDGEPSALVLSAARFLRDFYKKLSGLTGAKLPKLRRTFGRRLRHNSVGDFSAQYLNGRRQAMIFRLRGVALFRLSPRRTSPPETGSAARPDNCRWQPSSTCCEAACHGAAWQPVSAAMKPSPGADVHIANSLWLPRPASLLKNRNRSKIAARLARGARSQIAHTS